MRNVKSVPGVEGCRKVSACLGLSEIVLFSCCKSLVENLQGMATVCEIEFEVPGALQSTNPAYAQAKGGYCNVGETLAGLCLTFWHPIMSCSSPSVILPQ